MKRAVSEIRQNIEKRLTKYVQATPTQLADAPANILHRPKGGGTTPREIWQGAKNQNPCRCILILEKRRTDGVVWVLFFLVSKTKIKKLNVKKKIDGRRAGTITVELIFGKIKRLQKDYKKIKKRLKIVRREK